MRDFQERDTRPDPKDELRDRLKAEDDRYKESNSILRLAGLQDEYWPKSMSAWAKLESERRAKYPRITNQEAAAQWAKTAAVLNDVQSFLREKSCKK